MTTAETNVATLAAVNATIAQLTARILSVTASDQPDYSIDGESISKGSYLEQLQRTLDAQLKTRTILAGPYLVRSRGRAI